MKCFNSNSFVAWVMSFRSLSCWNIQTHFVLHDLTNRKTFYPKSHHMAPSILSFFSLVVLSLCRTKSSKARGYSEMAISNLCSRCTNSLHIINQFLRCFFEPFLHCSQDRLPPQVREILSDPEFLPFSKNCSYSLSLLAKLLA